MSLQKALGHASVKMTEISLRVANSGSLGVAALLPDVFGEIGGCEGR